MASTKFTYSPTGGTGSTTITCSVNETNIGQSDKTATITLTNGAVATTVVLKQRYRPYFQQFGSTTFPSTGGSIYFTVHTEYDIVFRSKPDWITIKLNDTTYNEGTRISSGVANNSTFTLEAAPNTGQSRGVGSTFNMGHYIGNTLASYVSYFSFTQQAMTGIATNVNEVVFDYNQTTGGTFNVISYDNWTSTITDNE